MRITNNMILNNSASNINGVKNTFDKVNTQMTNQQKINRPSEDPVIAVRSLRLQTSYSRVEQYYRKNIPDAASWLDVTETALTNIKDIITNMRTLCVQGSTGTLTQDDRNTILTNLKSLQSEIYTEGNADYAGRTVFTGYRTDKMLTFMGNESDTAYTISQKISVEDMMDTRYYSNDVPMPSTPDEVRALGGPDDADTKEKVVQKTDAYKMRLAYNDIYGVEADDSVTPPIPAKDPINSFKISYTTTDDTAPGATPILDDEGNPVLDNNKNPLYTVEITPDNVKIYDSESAWEEDSASAPKIKEVDSKDVVIIKGTGDIIFGNDIAYQMQSNKATVDIEYTKKGFLNSELRPEYYFNCQNISDPTKPIDYVKEDRDYDINYTIAENQVLTVNVEASNVFDHAPYQDMSDMINCVESAIKAHDKLDRIKSMMEDPHYSSAEDQAKLAQWKDLIQKEADFYDDNLDKLFTSELERADGYLADLNLNITRLGCTVDQLNMTEKRMSEQEEAVLALQSENDNLDLSQIIIDYTAIYTAYQSSLSAAGKLYQQTLLNYI